MKRRTIKVDVYDIDVTFFIGRPVSEPNKYMGHEVMKSDRKGNCSFNGKEVVLWVRYKYDHPTIAHECVHAAMFILDSCGVEISQKNDEALAYLVEYIYTRARE